MVDRESENSPGEMSTVRPSAGHTATHGGRDISLSASDYSVSEGEVRLSEGELLTGAFATYGSWGAGVGAMSDGEI